GDLGEAVQVLDVLALVVGLEERRLEPELARPALDPDLELGEAEAPVVLGRAAVQRVEVDPVHDLDPVVADDAHESPAAASPPDTPVSVLKHLITDLLRRLRRL